MAKKKQGKVQNGETWPGAFKAIALRSFSFGKFWQVCFLAVILFLLFRIDAKDFPTLLTILLGAKLFAICGWISFVVTAVLSVMVIRFMRKQYLGEIERLSTERNQLQEKLLGPDIAPSKYKAIN